MIYSILSGRLKRFRRTGWTGRVRGTQRPTCYGLEPARHTETRHTENHVADKLPERPDRGPERRPDRGPTWDLTERQHELVEGQKSSTRPTEVEGNCVLPMPPTGQGGLDDRWCYNNSLLTFKNNSIACHWSIHSKTKTKVQTSNNQLKTVLTGPN